MIAVLMQLALLAIFLFCYGGKSVYQKPVRPKAAKMLGNKNKLRLKKLLGLVDNLRTTK